MLWIKTFYINKFYFSKLVGVAGLEPTMTGSKPVALPLGYTPTLVRKERLELSRREALEPKSSVSTNSTTPAYFYPNKIKVVATAGLEPATPSL